MTKPVAILGTGPAGLMAAHACKLKGVPFSLFGLGDQSILGGAQFLHKALPYLDDETPDALLTYSVVGDPRSYKEKVYGAAEVQFVSASRVQQGQQVPAWSLVNSYQKLWDDIASGGNSINQLAVDPAWIFEKLEANRFQLIVSTIPRKSLCLTHAGIDMTGRAHVFVSQTVRIMNQCVLGDSFDNVIIYDGTPNVSWYRTSRIFGVGGTEWGESQSGKKLPYETVSAIKPLYTDCRCFTGKVLYTGRFGKWEKGVLTHQAFIDTWNALT